MEGSKNSNTAIAALVGLNALAAISWIAYDRLQPVLLQVLEVSDTGGFLDMVRAVVMVVVPVLSGWLAGIVLKEGSRSLLLSLTGMVMAAVVFVVLALDLQWILLPASVVPLMVFCWLIGINLFIGPANSLLITFTGGTRLAFAASVSLVTVDLLYAAEAVIGELLYDIGLVPVFAGAGIALALMAVIFKSVFTVMNNSATADDGAVRRDNFLVIAGAGLVLGMLFVSIGEFMPVWVLSKLQLPAWSEFPGGGKQTLESSVLVMAALVSIPAARYTERVGAARAMAFGLAGTVLSLAFSFVVPDAVAVLIAVLASGGFMALTTVAVLPFTAGHLKTASVPLGTGLLFTAVALPDAVVKIVLGWLG